ncbi:flagellar type III secretion system protein FlhA [Anaplasmataceae bacterium AB001_6]|nr:flagellar type III secretion system protein FlhA [Anaplasmataceae bacterium AB001_6]
MPNILNLIVSRIAQNSSIAFTGFILSIMAVILCPVPAQMLDFLFSISLTASILILINVLFIKRSLDFNAFPSILLITTMLRLSLNIASTRLILSKGHLGTSVAGHIIESFGNFVMQGSLAIGIIVFAIITIINFIVITKGSERIAEVSARFSLDAMPGKQMSIDADLAAGLIDEQTAKERRKDIEAESVFFGAMDGASKFVRGDAIAGLLIIFINFIGGILIGILQQNMSVYSAINTYTLLTIGDGLIGQMPSLTISIAAGLLVTKSGSNQSTDYDIISQITQNPKILIIAALIALGIGTIPGMPFYTFAITAGIIGLVIYTVKLTKADAEAIAKKENLVEEEQRQTTDTDRINNALIVDEIKIEIGMGIVMLLEELKENVKNMRLQIADELGFVLPYVRIIDNINLSDTDYEIHIKDSVCAKNTIYPNKIMVMNPSGEKIMLEGQSAVDPTFGLNVKWCDKNLASDCDIMNYTYVESQIVLITHLTEVIKNNFKYLVNHNTIKNILSLYTGETKRLIDEFVPSKISINLLKEILYNLLSEDLSIKDIGTIIEGISEIVDKDSNVENIVEHVRRKMSLQITSKYSNTDGNLNAISLSINYEKEIDGAITKNIPLSPNFIQEITKKINDVISNTSEEKKPVIVIVSDKIRAYVQHILRQFKIKVPVIGNNEIDHENVNINIIKNI